MSLEPIYVPRSHPALPSPAALVQGVIGALENLLLLALVVAGAAGVAILILRGLLALGIIR